MSKENTIHVTPRNRANGRLKGLGNLENPSQVLLRKATSSKNININHMSDQRWNMNFYKSKCDVNKKGKEVIMKKVIYEEYFKVLQGFKIDNDRPSKMSDKIYQHRTLESELSHEDYIIKGNVGGQDGGPPNFEQPIVV